MRIFTENDGEHKNVIIYLRIKKKDYYMWYRRIKRFFEKWGG